MGARLPIRGIVSEQPWRREALCKGQDPERWHPERGEDQEAAKAVCRQCPVIADCLRYALDEREPLGIWGGTSARERGRILGNQRLGIRVGPRRVAS